MARTLLIKKYQDGVFGHKDSEIPLQFFVSKFFIDIDQNYFQIKEGNGGSGAKRFPYLFTDVSVQVGNGAIETFATKEALFARLIGIRYTGMMDYFPTNGIVKSITINDTNYQPDADGLVDLGDVSGGTALPPLFGTFKRIRKGFGNVNQAINEVGDLFEGGVSDGIYAALASWNGGALDNAANFTIISTIEY